MARSYKHPPQLKRVYTPQSRLNRPLVLLREMFSDVSSSWPLTWRLFVKDIRAQYRQSFLGLFWTIIPAASTALAFTFASQSDVIQVGKTDIPYPAYVFFNILLWQTFTDSVNAPIGAVASARRILVKVNFPREAIVLASLMETLMNFFIKLGLALIMFAAFKVAISWKIIFAPLAAMSLVTLGASAGMLLAPFNVLYRDISKSIPIVFSIWVFFTPVVYPIPDSGLFALIVKLNPITPLIVTTRELATRGIFANPLHFGLVSLFSLFAFMAAWIIYRLAMPIVVERLGS